MEPRVRRLKTMLVFGRMGLRVAMGNTCGGVSWRAASRGRGEAGGECGVGRVWEGRERLLEKEGIPKGREV